MMCRNVRFGEIFEWTNFRCEIFTLFYFWGFDDFDPQILLQNSSKACKNHSEVVMNENPTNIPRVPPMFPTKDIALMMKYSFMTNFTGRVVLRSNDACGDPNSSHRVYPSLIGLNGSFLFSTVLNSIAWHNFLQYSQHWVLRLASVRGVEVAKHSSGR